MFTDIQDDSDFKLVENKDGFYVWVWTHPTSGESPVWKHGNRVIFKSLNEAKAFIARCRAAEKEGGKHSAPRSPEYVGF